MLFNTFPFIFGFLPIVIIGYFYLNNKKLIKGAKLWLIFSSLFFYSWWNIVYLPLILSSVFFNFYTSNKIQKVNKNTFLTKKLWFLIGLIFNVGLLLYFKYMDFFIENINYLNTFQLKLLHLALPLGISFYTLQQIAYLVDSYEGLVKEKEFLDYTLFVTFFPQLIAGPIVHYKEVMPQFASLKNKKYDSNNFALGLFVFALGLFKKIVIADTFSIWVHKGFDVDYSLPFLDAWVTSLSYTFQLYFDFSGYTDMAIGAALLLNIKLPQNFNSPLKATGMIDYWKRWHITLTNFITFYIYTPIIRSFNKLTFNKAMLTTIVAFLISGMWHGAGWTFIFWGFLHGSGVVINHYWHKWRKKKRNLPIWVAWLITFLFLNFANVFFRANSFNRAIDILKSMFNYNDLVVSDHLIRRFRDTDIFTKYIDIKGVAHSFIDLEPVLMVIFGFILILSFKNSTQLSKILSQKDKIPLLWHIWTILMLGISYAVMSFQTTTEFLYFNF